MYQFDYDIKECKGLYVSISKKSLNIQLYVDNCEPSKWRTHPIRLVIFMDGCNSSLIKTDFKDLESIEEFRSTCGSSSLIETLIENALYELMRLYNERLGSNDKRIYHVYS